MVLIAQCAKAYFTPGEDKKFEIKQVANCTVSILADGEKGIIMHWCSSCSVGGPHPQRGVPNERGDMRTTEANTYIQNLDRPVYGIVRTAFSPSNNLASEFREYWGLPRQDEPLILFVEDVPGITRYVNYKFNSQYFPRAPIPAVLENGADRNLVQTYGLMVGGSVGVREWGEKSKSCIVS